MNEKCKGCKHKSDTIYTIPSWCRKCSREWADRYEPKAPPAERVEFRWCFQTMMNEDRIIRLVEHKDKTKDKYQWLTGEQVVRMNLPPINAIELEARS